MVSKVQLSRTVQYRWKIIKNRPLGTINRGENYEIMGKKFGTLTADRLIQGDRLRQCPLIQILLYLLRTRTPTLKKNENFLPK